MSFPLLMVLFFPLLLAPVATYQLVEGALAWQRAQIAVDNAAITLGESGEEVFRFLLATNRVLRRMDAAHHIVHFCAKAPQTAVNCGAADKLLEARIRQLRAHAHRYAQVHWERARVHAGAEAARLVPSVGIVHPRLRLFSRVCPVCGLAVYWEVGPNSGPIQSRLWAPHPHRPSASVAWHGRSLLQGEPWRYSMAARAELP